ncbi:MAG: DUF4261 domain-containing protein [Ruminococcus sp.]|nr:DUF4261 domain-containing protein [Ruminococcus sp.]
MSENKEKKLSTVLGFVLLTDANLDWPRFRHNLKEDWDISFGDEIKDGAVVFSADGFNCACSLLPNPVPNNEAVECAKNNMLWKDAAAETAKHAAHVMIAVMGSEDEGYDSLEANKLFCKLASAMLKLKNTIGIYKNPTVFEKQFYIDVAENLKNGDLPVPIMLHVGMYLNSDSLLCGFTYGLRAFGFEEIEVIGSRAQPPQLFNFLLAISDYVISGDVVLRDGETVGFTDEQKLPITHSKAVSFDGDSLKIGFMTE